MKSSFFNSNLFDSFVLAVRWRFLPPTIGSNYKKKTTMGKTQIEKIICSTGHIVMSEPVTIFPKFGLLSAAGVYEN